MDPRKQELVSLDVPMLFKSLLVLHLLILNDQNKLHSQAQSQTDFLMERVAKRPAHKKGIYDHFTVYYRDLFKIT